MARTAQSAHDPALTRTTRQRYDEIKEIMKLWSSLILIGALCPDTATSMSLEDKMKIIEEQAHIIFEFYVAFHWVLNFDNPSFASKECSVVEYSPSK